MLLGHASIATGQPRIARNDITDVLFNPLDGVGVVAEDQDLTLVADV
jgi:hypothetical protein